MGNDFSVHKKSAADGHLLMKYLGKNGVVERDCQAFCIARERVMLWVSQEFVRTSQISVGELSKFVGMAKKELLMTALAYASTLFSALNSPFGYLPKNREHYISEMKVAMITIRDMPSEWLAASHREVLMACYQKLAPSLGFDFCDGEAKKLGFEVLSDDSATKATKLLVQARLSQMRSLPHSVRWENYKAVRVVLRRGMRNPDSIKSLDQDWKTYVRLARIVRKWKPMFYGLKKDGFSLDLTVKSLIVIVGTFLTDQRKFWKGIPI